MLGHLCGNPRRFPPPSTPGPRLGRCSGSTFLRRFISDKDCIFRETLRRAEVHASSDVTTIAFGVRRIL
jgi:hypothetical protein